MNFHKFSANLWLFRNKITQLMHEFFLHQIPESIKTRKFIIEMFSMNSILNNYEQNTQEIVSKEK